MVSNIFLISLGDIFAVPFSLRSVVDLGIEIAGPYGPMRAESLFGRVDNVLEPTVESHRTSGTFADTLCQFLRMKQLIFVSYQQSWKVSVQIFVVIINSSGARWNRGVV